MNLAAALGRRLEAMRGSDGGYPPVRSGASEPEPTALAALALNDPHARRWLNANQRSDGSFGISLGTVDNDSATALAALAMGPGDSANRALDHIETTTARVTVPDSSIPYNPAFPGWAWTDGTFGWVEPTSRALLALRMLRPSASGSISDSSGMLADRESVGGGWNYGNRIVFGVDLPPYAETTAMALIALQGLKTDLVARGIARLKELWRQEREGTLSVAAAAVALQLNNDPDADAALKELASHDLTHLEDVVTLAWASIATGPGLGRIRVSA